MPTRYQRYILREWSKVFFIAIGLVAGLVFIQELYSKLDGLLSAGATYTEAAMSFLLTIPLALPAILPLVLLLSVLFSLGSLHRKNEIIAMKAAGISLWKISQPLLGVAGICAAGILVLNASLIPWSVEKQDALNRQIHLRNLDAQEQSSSRRMARVLHNLGVIQFREQRLWLMGSFVPATASAEDVTVYQMNDAGEETFRIRAEAARFLGVGEGWLFENGNALYFDGESEEPYRNQRFDSMLREDYQDDPGLMVALRRKPQDLSLHELRYILQTHSGFETALMRPYQVRYYRMWLSPLFCFLVVLFGVPFAVGGVRVDPMVGISKAVGMFLVYFLVSNISLVIGQGGWISPLLAAVLPLFLVGAVSAIIYSRSL